MKHAILFFTTLICTVSTGLQGQVRESLHFSSAVAALSLGAAAGVSTVFTLHHKRKLEQLREQLKQFEGQPLRMIYLDNEAQLRLKKSMLATGFFTGASLLSLIAWVATLPNDVLRPQPQPPKGGDGVVGTPPDCRGRGGSDVPTVTSTAVATPVPSADSSPLQPPRSVGGDGVDRGAQGTPSLGDPSPCTPAASSVMQGPVASSAPPVTRAFLRLSVLRRPVPGPPPTASLMTQQVHRSGRKVVKFSINSLKGPSSRFIERLWEHFNVQHKYPGKVILLSGTQPDGKRLPRIEFLHFIDLVKKRQITNREKLEDSFASGQLGLRVRYAAANGVMEEYTITDDKFRLSTHANIHKLVIGVFNEGEHTGHIWGTPHRRRHR